MSCMCLCVVLKMKVSVSSLGSIEEFVIEDDRDCET